MTAPQGPNNNREALQQPTETATETARHPLTEMEKAEIDRFLFERYKLSALALAVVAFGLGFLIQHIVIEVAETEAREELREALQETHEYLREHRNNHVAKMVRLQAMADRAAAIEDELYQAFKEVDLITSAGAAVGAAGWKTTRPRLTSFGPLQERITSLGPHDLCFLATVDLDPSIAQACELTQTKGEWIAETQATSCQVTCIDFQER